MKKVIFSDLPKNSEPPVCEVHQQKMEYDEELELWLCPMCSKEIGRAAKTILENWNRKK